MIVHLKTLLSLRPQLSGGGAYVKVLPWNSWGPGRTLWLKDLAIVPMGARALGNSSKLVVFDFHPPRVRLAKAHLPEEGQTEGVSDWGTSSVCPALKDQLVSHIPFSFKVLEKLKTSDGCWHLEEGWLMQLKVSFCKYLYTQALPTIFRMMEILWLTTWVMTEEKSQATWMTTTNFNVQFSPGFIFYE